jgi:hypothetical protein
MPWNSNSPDGTLSVRANRIPMNQNTTYIETTMGNSIVGTNTVSTRDHFWNVGSDEDGRHRFFQSVGFTQGVGPTVPADPVIGTGMDGVIYLREVLGRVEGFYKNRPLETAGTPYQFIPTYLIGVVKISGGSSLDWVTLAPIPTGSYGEIFMFKDSDFSICQSGIFSTSASLVRGYSLRSKHDGTADDYFLELRNITGNGLNLQARRGNSGSSSDGIWHYRITYRAF